MPAAAMANKTAARIVLNIVYNTTKQRHGVYSSSRRKLRVPFRPQQFSDATRAGWLGIWRSDGVATRLAFYCLHQRAVSTSFQFEWPSDWKHRRGLQRRWIQLRSTECPSFGNHLGGQSKSDFLNGLFPASAFPAPPLGQEGNLGRNTFDQPGLNNVDLTLTRNISTKWFFGEALHLQLQLQAEVYNLFNRVNLTSVDSDLSSSLFGHATSQSPARSLQLHIRASF